MSRRSVYGRLLTLAIAVSFFIAGAESAMAANELLPGSSYATGSRPLSVVRADVDLDGDADILVAEAFNKCVAVMRNDGSGRFARVSSWVVASQPVCVASGKIDGDSYPDMAVADERAGRVYVRLNDRTGRFGAASYYTIGQPSSVALRDVSGDGKTDLIATSQQSDEVIILYGNGAGAFSGRRDYKVQRAPRSLDFADLDRDGRTDIVTANVLSNTISVLMGTRAGFSPAKSISTNAEPFHVEVADVDGNGAADIAVTHKQSDSVWTFMNNGSGQFTLAPWLSVDHDPTSGSLADLNGDGRLDLITASYLDNVVSTFLGDGTGSWIPSTSYPCGSGPWASVAGDVDGDQRADIVTADAENDTISVLRSNTGASATSLTFSGTRTIYYGKSSVLSASLAAGGVGAGGQPVVFEKKTSIGWARVGTAITSSSGVTRLAVKPSAATTYRARFSGGTVYRASTGTPMKVAVRAYLSTPGAPSSVGRARTFSVSGYLKPRHPSGSRSVKLYCYRYESGRWALRKTIMATNRNYSSYTKFTASASLPSRGRWRIRAYHGDAGHAGRYSGYRYVTVR